MHRQGRKTGQPCRLATYRERDHAVAKRQGSETVVDPSTMHREPVDRATLQDSWRERNHYAALLVHVQGVVGN